MASCFIHYLQPPIHRHANIAFIFPTIKLTWPAKEEAVCFPVLAFAVDFLNMKPLISLPHAVFHFL